jgi:lambda repressor-like predicted transcriptional regulator
MCIIALHQVHSCTATKPLAAWQNSRMDDEQKAARALVQAMLDKTGLKPTQLARKAKLSPTTVTRFLAKDDIKHSLSARSLNRLAAASEMIIAFGGGSGAPERVGDPIEDERELRWVQLWRRMSTETQDAVYASLSTLSASPKNAA